MEIASLKKSDLPAVKAFTDREIGHNYYSSGELQEIYQRSQSASVMCSLVLRDGDLIRGVRISYPPNQWEKGKGSGLTPSQWPHPLSRTGYFQSIFLDKSLRGEGWGGKLSQEAISRLVSCGALGIVCHSWKESPNNSSTRYLLKLGFKVITEHREYWRDVQYDCTRCLKPPCKCTAIEMYLDLNFPGG